MIEKILKEINRLKNELDGYSASEALDYIEAYINTLQKEPASEDLEEAAQEYSFNIPTQLEADSVWKRETEQHFKDGAEWQKQQMKEALQTEYEKGRFDMREEMMKDAVEGEVFSEIKSISGSEFRVRSNRFKMDGIKMSDKVKIVVLKTE